MSKYKNLELPSRLEDIADDEILSIIKEFKQVHPKGMNKSNCDEFESRIREIPDRFLTYMLKHTKEVEILEAYVEYALLNPLSHTVHGLEYVATNPNASPKILNQLSRLGYVYLPEKVANNPSVSTDILRYMKRYCRDQDGKNAAIRQLKLRGEK